MTRVVRYIPDPVLPASCCLRIIELWWWLAAAAVRASADGWTDLARSYAAHCRKLIVAVGKPTERLSFPDVPSRSAAA